jgi:hypothetical protein
MKRLFYLSAFVFLSSITTIAQTAVDFTANDCAGVSHHLFDELDAGKIIVVSFVMPCGTCIGPSNSTETVVDGFATSHPGKVLYYVADDLGTSSCSSLTSWESTNGITPNATFSTPLFVEAQYGSGGMPKIVVIGGGSTHHVYFTQNGSVNTTNLQNAINTAISATAAVKQVKSDDLGLGVFPNPATDRIAISYNLAGYSDVSMEIYNLIGSRIKTVFLKNQVAGQHDINVSFDDKINNGVYFVKLDAGGNTQIMKFIIAR